jgi:hypothetical protein
MSQNAKSTQTPLAELHQLWDKLSDVPTVYEGPNEGQLEEKFQHFEPGTPREDVWRWFEKQNKSFIVGEVMHGIRRVEHPTHTFATPEARYKNPWHKANTTDYGPEYYTTTVKPIEHAGHLIYQRIEGHVWDVVKDGVCINQMAGPNGAKQAAEQASAAAQAKSSGPSM